MRITSKYRLWLRIQKPSLLATVLFAAIVVMSAAPGDLDPTFGNGGKVTTASGGAISDIAIQPDGKIVAVSGDMIFRYNSNGSLDSSFGTGGTVILQLDENILGFAGSVTIQTDGRIVVAGGNWDEVTGYGFAVVRFNPNGTLDTTFNGTGIIFFPNQNGYASAVAIQTDGKLVVTCSGQEYSGVFRYNSNGTPDTSFNGTGSVITSESGASSVAIQPDGKIIVGGSSVTSPNNYFYAIFRYNADGSPDTSFGNAGVVVSYLGGWVVWSFGSKVAIQTDGKIVARVAGWATDDFGEGPFNLIVRHNPAGSIDATFANNNGVIFESSVQNPGDLVIQPDGKIVSVDGWGFVVRRYNPNGLPDASFGDGMVTTDFDVGPYSSETALAVAIQTEGKIVAAGVARNINPGTFEVTYHFALARYQGGSLAPVTISGRVTTANGRGVGGAVVSMIDSAGMRRTARTNTFGYYSFQDIAGDTYTISVRSKRFQFQSRTVFAGEDLFGIDFISLN